jgi:GNAT superfamily N-acetyltransferase
MKFIEYNVPLNEEQIHELAALFRLTFGHEAPDDFGDILNEKHNLIALLAIEEEHVVGFKLGYERYRQTFFSWLGGVIPQRRREGIANLLMREQHQRVAELGYTEIQTETFGDEPGMLILNLKEGFTIYGTHVGTDRRVRVEMTKRLNGSDTHRGVE